MSNAAVTTNTAAPSRDAAIAASDGRFFSLNEAYASPGLFVATSAAPERAQGHAPDRMQAPVRHATPEDTAVIDTMLRAMGRESPIYRAMPVADRKLADYIAKVIGSSEHAVLLHEGPPGIDGIEDLKAAGLGSGRHGFEFAPPVGLKFASDTIEVRRSLDGTALERSGGAGGTFHNVMLYRHAARG
jgi:hypothetical protein